MHVVLLYNLCKMHASQCQVVAAQRLSLTGDIASSDAATAADCHQPTQQHSACCCFLLSHPYGLSLLLLLLLFLCVALLQKPTKAQKRREKLAAKQAEREARIAAELAESGPSERQEEEKELKALLAPLGLGINEIRVRSETRLKLAGCWLLFWGFVLQFLVHHIGECKVNSGRLIWNVSREDASLIVAQVRQVIHEMVLLRLCGPESSTDGTACFLLMECLWL